MIPFGGTYYYIDLNALEKTIGSDTNDKQQEIVDVEVKTFTNEEGKVISTETIERKYQRNKEVDGTKYTVVSMMIETVVDYIDNDMNDTSLGEDRALNKAPLAFKIAFNTLLNEGIIKEK